MRHATALFLLLLAACGGSQPAPLPKITLPPGSSLRPYDAAHPGTARPYGATELGGKVYVALGNLNGYDVAGPGFLAGIVPSTNATDLFDLGGDNGRACQNAFSVKTDGSRLYVACSGDFNTGGGHALVEVDPRSPGTKRTLTLPTSFSPGGIAITTNRIWVANGVTAELLAIDPQTFAAAGAPVPLECHDERSAYAADIIAAGGDLYAICGSAIAGRLYRLDPATGALRGKVVVGAIPTSLIEVGDGRIAVLCSGDSTLWMATPGASGAVSAALAYTYASGTASLQEVRAAGRFLYTTASLSNTVQKIDISTTPAKVVSEQRTGKGPWSVVPLDENVAVVSDSLDDDLTSVDFRAQAK